MPERFVLVRWPDGAAQRIYSPSTVVEEFFAAGQRFAVDEFVEQSRRALAEASERVRVAYGHPCAHAARSIREVEARAAAQAHRGDVLVEGVEA
ncbi:MSMEG_0570 family nitrogen starvation response protein [Dactylosporangium sp. CA-139066]|uniref:MSMEG_0570 family nitrogen starvation response protein n=1 Tax=Dactylosporangium sp. CA-139066 TaxID=3239930 RepID=UPI003D8C098F